MNLSQLFTVRQKLNSIADQADERQLSWTANDVLDMMNDDDHKTTIAIIGPKCAEKDTFIRCVHGEASMKAGVDNVPHRCIEIDGDQLSKLGIDMANPVWQADIAVILLKSPKVAAPERESIAACAAYGLRCHAFVIAHDSTDASLEKNATEIANQLAECGAVYAGQIDTDNTAVVSSAVETLVFNAPPSLAERTRFFLRQYAGKLLQTLRLSDNNATQTANRENDNLTRDVKQELNRLYDNYIETATETFTDEYRRLCSELVTKLDGVGDVVSWCEINLKSELTNIADRLTRYANEKCFMGLRKALAGIKTMLEKRGAYLTSERVLISEQFAAGVSGAGVMVQKNDPVGGVAAWVLPTGLAVGFGISLFAGAGALLTAVLGVGALGSSALSIYTSNNARANAGKKIVQEVEKELSDALPGNISKYQTYLDKEWDAFGKKVCASVSFQPQNHVGNSGQQRDYAKLIAETEHILVELQ